MELSARPLRSVLYIPASRDRALEKARGLPTDAIIFDLEDAVLPEEKPAARDLLAAALTQGGYGARWRIVRVNGPDTPWHDDDLDAVSRLDADAILLPKVNTADEVERVARRLGPDGPELWAMMETPQGVLNAAAIARASRMAGFVMGTNDLVKDLGARSDAARQPLMTALQTCVLAARAAGIVCIDGVYNAFKDEEGLRAECLQGRDLGMDGKTLIHPAQLAIANEVFAPAQDDLETARRQIAAFDEAQARGEGVAVLDGKIVENLHVATAKATLARAEAIARMESA